MPGSKPPSKRPNSYKKQSLKKRASGLFLPWPYVVFILLSIGVLLAGWTFQAEADDLAVSATVPAPPLNESAFINSPMDGKHFSQEPIAVGGTCPLNSYVKLYRNNVFSGTALCSSAGTFQLNTDLFSGANQLKAQDFNVTDAPGPSGNTVTVYYDLPQQQLDPSGLNSSGLSSSAAQNAAPFEVQSDFKYKSYVVGQTVSLSLEAGGGISPYAFNVDWGDSTNTVLSQKDPGKFTVSHRYKTAGSSSKGSYTVKISGADSTGTTTYIQMFLVVKRSSLPNFVASSLPPGPHISKNWLLLAWPAYLTLLLMAASFWLGEREEIINLKKRGILRGNRA